jgi:hypothetical protein
MRGLDPRRLRATTRRFPPGKRILKDAQGGSLFCFFKSALERRVSCCHYIQSGTWFPEAALSGYTKSQITSWDQVDGHARDDELCKTGALASELGLWVVFGCNHRLTPPHQPHNSLYVVSGRGERVTRYDKRFCSNTEVTRFYTPGREACVFEVGGWRFGCALCLEIQYGVRPSGANALLGAVRLSVGSRVVPSGIRVPLATRLARPRDTPAAGVPLQVRRADSSRTGKAWGVA